MRYAKTTLQPTIQIDGLFTLYYFEFGKHYVFPGETHDFWEMLYVDKGELSVHADERAFMVKQGTVIFHKPNEFHQFHAENGKAPNLIVMTFDSASPAMQRFANAVITLRDEERKLLALIVQEGREAFRFPFRHPLRRRKNALLGAEQMLRLHLEMLLIRLLRRDDWEAVSSTRTSTPARQKEADSLAERAIRLMEQRLGEPLSLQQISSALTVSKTQLKEMFKHQTGVAVMDYYARLKMDRAKLLIREANFNFTEIAELLGFSSVHVFSRSFKRLTDMSPSEYAKSIKGQLHE